MKISSITIEKFRSIKKAQINMHDILAVVGENNAGKTAVLKAINAVLNYKNEEMNFLSKAHQFAPRNNTYITICFTDIPDSELYKNKIYRDTLTLHFTYTYGENKKKYFISKGTERIPIDDTFLNEMSNDIIYVYIPAERTNSDISWNDASIYKQLLINYASLYNESRDRISGHVRKATEKIHSSILMKLEDQINTLYMQNKSVDFKLKFPSDLDFTALLDQVKISLNDHNSTYELREWGSGTKSLAVIAMHRANALMKNRSIVLGIEEPETNLHPQAQKRFIYSLKNDLQSNETQTIFTTHSTVLINELSHDDILLVRRKNDSIRDFVSTTTQLPSDFWEKYGLEEFKHYQYFNYKNSDFFFSKFVIIGESKNDCQVFMKLISDDIGDRIADISFLNAEGVESIKYPFFLLRELKIPYITIVDRDYFFDYLNSKLEDSRNETTGLPIYKSQLKDNAVINTIFNTEDKKRELILTHTHGYRKFFEYIKQFNILSMNYCLEMDLTCSASAREKYYEALNVMPDNKTQSFLLIKNQKAIKKIETILSILEQIPKTSYPESYLKIKNVIIQEINNTVV